MSVRSRIARLNGRRSLAVDADQGSMDNSAYVWELMLELGWGLLLDLGWDL